jgi:hypothetical protein
MSPSTFDPSSCANALEALAATARSYAAPLSTLRAQSLIVREAVKLLGPACLWLKKRQPSGSCPGEPILRAATEGARLAVDTFVKALRDTAAELEVSQGAFRTRRGGWRAVWSIRCKTRT